MADRPKVFVCLTPKLLDLYDLENTVVVVTDVLRATSAMVVALNKGIDHIVPVQTIEESLALKKEGYMAAAERNGQIVDGFEIGNSPVAYNTLDLKGKKLAITTTNGTKAIQLSSRTEKVLIGAFINLQAVVQELKNLQQNVVIVCAGWKDQANLEDTLFAGAVVYHLLPKFDIKDDAAFIANKLYEAAKDDLFLFIQNSSHYSRLSKLGIEDDIRFCMRTNMYTNVPVLKEGKLVNL